MAELFIELLSEEIPARMQKTAKNNFEKLIIDFLKKSKIHFNNIITYVTPRRICINIDDIPVVIKIFKKKYNGPKVNASKKAIEGFLRKTGVSIDQCIKEEIKGKEIYVAIIEKKEQQTSDIIASFIPILINKFPWPKSMRWGSNPLRWIRPLRSIICLFNSKIIPFKMYDIPVGNHTYGHLFMNNKYFKVNNFNEYINKLLSLKVIVNDNKRKFIILTEARKLCSIHGLKLIEDKELISETAGLVEWPVVLLGTFKKNFLNMPKKIIIETIKEHQKCFSVLDFKTNKLSNYFIIVSNMIALDGGKVIVRGNEKVIDARLSDANFFWKIDKKITLESRINKLKNITFHRKIGSQYDRVQSILKLAKILSKYTNANWKKTKLAVKLSKTDLVTLMVNELPKLQGYIGQQYALIEGVDVEVANAILMHYAPSGKFDIIPTNIVALTVSLADKFNTLLSFWSINKKPTGSKDPFGLRRAALGIIRIIIERNIRLNIPDELLTFFIDRFKIYLKNKNIRYDLINSVVLLKKEKDIGLIQIKILSLINFLSTSNGLKIFKRIKRVYNILHIEEKKDNIHYNNNVNKNLLTFKEEKKLYFVIQNFMVEFQKNILKEDFLAAMNILTKLCSPIDDFFNNIKINDDNYIIRINRLKLLGIIRSMTQNIADFSYIQE